MSEAETTVKRKLRMKKWLTFQKEVFQERGLIITDPSLGKQNWPRLKMNDHLVFEQGFLRITITASPGDDNWIMLCSFKGEIVDGWIIDKNDRVMKLDVKL